VTQLKVIQKRMVRCISPPVEMRLIVRYHEFPGWIEKIWIHIVTGVNPKEEKSKNAPERFQTAFTGIPTDVWTTFESPSELAGHLPSPEQPQQG